MNREGLLFDAADKNIRKFNIAASAPKDNKTGKTKKLAEWTLSHLINVAHEVGVISLDVKEYGQKLINFRNYIHPLEQLRQKFNPDIHTGRISWHVLQAAISDLNQQRPLSKIQ